MKLLTIAAMFIAAFAVILASPTNAKNEEAKGKAKEVMQDRSRDVAERAEIERDRRSQRDELTRKRGKGAGDDESPDGDESYDDDAGNNSDRDKSGEARDNAATRGNEKAEEMRARRDERKVIMEEYKAEDKARDAGLDGDADALDTDIDEDSRDKGKKEKKSWWKFWE